MSRRSKLYRCCALMSRVSPSRSASCVGFHDLPTIKVAATQIADLAARDQVVGGTQCFFQRREGVGAMQLVEVDIVGA